MRDISKSISYRIRGKGRGWTFSNKDFLDLGPRPAVDKTLSRLACSGKIRRIQRGLYDYPRQSQTLGSKLSPDYDQVARALARRNGWKILAAGAWAANLLGLSTQVPARIVYLTDGPSLTLQLGKQVVEFKHAAPKVMRLKGDLSALVIQALHYLGREGTDRTTVEKLRRQLNIKDRRHLLKNAKYGTGWIYDIVREIVATDEE